MKENKEIEKILLNDSAYEKMVKSKIELEFEQEISASKSVHSTNFITEIKDAPKDKIFSKTAIYEILNKDSKTKSYINGLQAEGYLGTTADRLKLLRGETDAFVNGNIFIKFVKVKI